MKLTRTRRVSHVDDLLLTDPAAALLAGLTTLPKKSALTDYSYRTSHDHQRALLAALDTKMIAGGLTTSDETIFDLDFHAVMLWGADPDLEKHYVPTRSQRSRSVLTFLAQDSGTHNLVYANADLSKATHNREVIAFCDHWRNASGNDPHMLVMDQKVTTQPALAELDARRSQVPHPADALTRTPAPPKSSLAPHRGHPNGATNPRTGAHRGPHTESINRSWASASTEANAWPGSSLPICTANDSNSDHDERVSSTRGSTVSVRTVADMG